MVGSMAETGGVWYSVAHTHVTWPWLAHRGRITDIRGQPAGGMALKGNAMNSQFDQVRARAVPADGAMDMSIDAGLRAYMLGIYNKMGLGLVLSGALAFVTSSYEPVKSLLFVDGGGYTGLGMVLAFAPMVVLFGSMFAMRNPSKTGASALYWVTVALIGAGLGVLALRYTGESIASTFFITAAAFGGLSLFGYTTKKNLSGMGSFLIMGVFGLIIASLVNVFLLKSGVMAMAISGLGVLIFSGLIAYDTQRLKHEYYYLQGDGLAMSVATSMGALSLYLNFINLFQFLMSFLGQRE
jgi:uncharacterized protein